jgi:hypothetical protein
MGGRGGPAREGVRYDAGMITRLSFVLALALVAGCPSSTTTQSDAGGVDGGGVDGGGVDGGSDTGAADAGGTDAGGSDTGSDAGTRVPALHRADDSVCQASAPAGNCSFGGGPGPCSMDSDCAMGTNGRCNMNLGGAAFCRCTYDTCTHDTDCPSGQTCACHGSPYHADGNTCVPGNCRVDADCGARGYCSPSIAPMGCGGLGGYYCHTAGDLCVDDADCGGGRVCAYVDASRRWECVMELLCP